MERLRGLLGRPPLAPGEGLLISPCTSVHTWGMSYRIDVVFLDDGGRIVALYPALPPRRVTRIHRDAASVLELSAGTLETAQTSVGDRVERATDLT